MIRLQNVCYVRLGTRDLEGATQFATGILGLEVSEWGRNTCHLKSDQRAHTLCYFDGDPKIQIAGFEVAGNDDLDHAATELEKLGQRVRVGTREEADERMVREFIGFSDPTGNRIEIAWRPAISGTHYHGTRDAGITGFSHIGLCTTDAARDEAFWTQVCNARVSDRIGDAPLLRIDEVHHSIAMFPADRPGIQHINHQVETSDDLMRSFNFLKECGVNITFGPGRHPSSSASFLYFEGPDGMTFEYSSGVRTITDELLYRERQLRFDPKGFCQWVQSPIFRSSDRGIARNRVDVTMEQIKPKPETCRRGESPHRLCEADCIDLREQVIELAAQQAAMTEILSSIANSPHKPEPIFDLVTANATRLCRAEVGALILFEGQGYRLAARAGEVDTYYVKDHVYPAVDGAPSARMKENKSPVHITDLAADQAYLQRIPELVALVERIGVRTYLLIPMLKRDQIVGGIAVARACVQPFTDRQIELISAFAAQATIVLENTCRERQLRQMQTDLTYATRLVALEQLSASIAHEIKQPISAVSTFAQSALRWMDRRSPVLEEVRQALSNIVSANKRADDIVGRITDLIKKAAPRMAHLEINGAIRDVIEFIRGEAAKNGVSVRIELAQGLPLVRGDRVQLQQVILNLIMNAVEAMDGVDGTRELIISTEAAESEGVLVAVRDFGPGLAPALHECAFNAFYTTKSGGVGVGLSISRSIIEAHGGRLWASETEPRGALFQFTLPPGDSERSY